MEKYENEQFKVDEITKIEEYQHFKAEDFKSLELFSLKNEEYKVEEIQKQSFVEDSKKGNKPKKKDNSSFNKIKNKLLSSSTSASASTTIGSAGAIISAGVIGASIVLAPVLDISIFPSENEISEDVLVDYGSIDMKNYFVNIDVDDDNQTSKSVTLYFDENLNDEYQCNILNQTTGENKPLDKTLDYVTFENLTEENYDFEVLIKNMDDFIVDRQNLTIKTNGSIVFSNEYNYELLVTYNEDATFNVYYHPEYDYENNNIDLDAFLTDSDGNLLHSNKKTIDNVFYFEDIEFSDFTINTKAYLIEDNNTFLIHNKTIDCLSPYSFDYNISVNNQEVIVDLNGNLSDDIKVSITDINDNKIGTYTYLKEQWTGNVNIPLTIKTEEINVILETATTYINSTSNSFVNYKGSLNQSHTIDINIPTNIKSEIKLESIEVLNESFSNDNDEIPTVLHFDGFLRIDEAYKVFVFNESNNLLYETTYLSDIKTPLVIYNLPTDQILSFKYSIFNNNQEINSYSYQASLAIPEEYLLATDNITMQYENPNQVARTFNEDGTINYYFYTALQNNTNYDANVRISLYTDYNLETSITKYSSDKVLVIESINEKEHYGLMFNLAIKDDLVYYVIDNPIMPSGVLNEDRLDDGRYFTYVDINETNIFKQYEVDLNGQVFSDLEIEIIFDDKTLNLTILQSEITDNKFLLDLSPYEFNNAIINITGLLDISKLSPYILEEIQTYKGSVYTNVLASSSVDVDYGYAYYSKHTVNSNIKFDEATNEEILYNDVYIYVDAYTNDFFYCKVVNKHNNTSLVLDEDLQYVVFYDLVSGTYDFEIQIVDENGKIYDSSNVSISTESDLPYTNSIKSDMLITYNADDNTYNLYYYPILDYSSNVIETTYILQDEDGNEIDNIITQNNGVTFERIANHSFKINMKSYLKDGYNLYLIASETTQLFDTTSIPYVINKTSENEIEISLKNQLESDIIINVTYMDDNTTESFVVSKDDWTGKYILTLSKTSIDVQLNISASLVIFNQNDENNINYYIGSTTKDYEVTEIIK